ncbi:MAG TPA: iron-containing alcohol dehydrogenase [Stellaceae bacterium]|nr:iron-containing alcohol dehydrogenase [Stellaceae bacterium]
MNPLIQLPRVHLDWGARAVLPDELALLGIARPLFVTDRGVVGCGAFARVRETLGAEAPCAVYDGVPENPTVAGVEGAFQLYRAERCDGVVAVGGGSVIDSAKAVALLAGHPQPLAHYLGHPERITARIAPLVAIPTTAGTGSEASRGAGIHPDATSRGASLGSPHIVPKAAICDPELTLTLPPHLTAATGMDALSHCVEAYLANTDHPPSDAVALDGAGRVARWIERAVEHGGDREARRQMMLAALAGGIALSCKGAGPAHAIANTFGDRGLHHGAMVTIALPPVLRLLERHAPEKMRQLAAAMQAPAGQSAADMIERLNARVGLPKSLRALGYAAGDLDEMAEDAARSHFNARAAYRPSAADFCAMMQEAWG